MEINIEWVEEVNISELDMGAIFRYKGAVYLKCAQSTSVQNAVNLVDGVLVIITKGTRILPLEGILEVR